MPYDFSGIAKHASEVTSALLAKNNTARESAQGLDYYLLCIQQNAENLQKTPADAELLTQMAVHTGLATQAAHIEKSDRLGELEQLSEAIAKSDTIGPAVNTAALAISLRNFSPDNDPKHRVLTMREHRLLIKALDGLEDAAHKLTTGVVGRPKNYNPEIYFTKDMEAAFDNAIKVAKQLGKIDYEERLIAGKATFQKQGLAMYKASTTPVLEFPAKVAEAAREAVKPQTVDIPKIQPMIGESLPTMGEIQPMPSPKPKEIGSQITP